MVKISRDYLHLFFRKKLFLKKFSFLSLHDNKGKNYPIVLKFVTDVDFIYLQIEFVAKKIGRLRKKICLKIKIKNFESPFFQEYLVYRLEILTSYCTNWKLMWLKFQKIIFICFLEKNYIWQNLRFRWRTKSKNYPIILKFGTDEAFIYIQIEFVAQKNRFISNEDI